MQQAEARRRLTARQCLVDGSHNVNVLLRHRLLLKPRGFEGFARVGVQLCPCLLAVPGSWRRTPWLGALLVLAGLAAVIHGAFALVT